jgi:hypothetical protein
MPRIFISYRHQDEPTVLRDEIVKRLIEVFGSHNIIMDTKPEFKENKSPDLREHIRQLVRRCDVLLVVIGKKWAEIGRSKVKDGEDYVRLEIGTGFQCDNVLIIPVLLNDTDNISNLDNDIVQDDVRTLNYQRGHRVREDYFQIDMDELVSRIRGRYEQHGGISRVYGRFPVNIFRDYILEAEKIVRISQTWIMYFPAIDVELRKATTNKNVLVKILLLDPDSVFALQRSIDFDQKLDPSVRSSINVCDEISSPKLYSSGNHEVKRNIHRTLEDIKSIAGDNKIRHNMEVRFYNTTPTFPVYQVDNRAFISVFPHKYPALACPYLEVDDLDSSVGKVVNDDFEFLWGNANRYYDLDDFVIKPLRRRSDSRSDGEDADT